MFISRLFWFVGGMGLVFASIIMMVGLAFGLELKSVVWLLLGLVANFVGCMVASYSFMGLMMSFMASPNVAWSGGPDDEDSN